LDKGTQKEVCDFIIVVRNQAILISMKAQEKTQATEPVKSWSDGSLVPTSIDETLAEMYFSKLTVTDIKCV
jgi:hypothetical protein